jgi:hypothetical protein
MHWQSLEQATTIGTPVLLVINFVMQSFMKQKIDEIKILLYRDFVTQASLANQLHLQDDRNK